MDYNRSWDWVNLTYADFWTLDGFVRNLFFNGWHPVFPWIGFLLYGMILSRLSLGEIATQRNLVIFGAVLLAIAEGASAAITPKLHSMDPLLAPLGSTSSLPPLPLYTLAGIGAASMAIGICLAVAEMAKRLGILRLVVPAGRQTLTLYFAHVFVGVVMMEELGSLVDQELSVAVIAALAFCTISAVYAFFWSEKFKRGPLEELMSRFSG